VKDLRARSNIVVILLAALSLVGCQSLNATRPSSQQNSAEVMPAVSHLEFGSVVVGYKQLLSNVIVNHSSSTVTLASASVDQPDFKITAGQLPVTLASGESTTFGVTYQPKAHGSSTGTVTVADATASTSTSFTVSGSSTTPGQLTVSPSSISFGSVMVGQTQRQSATVSNTGGSDITITQASVSGSGFSLSGLALPLTLHPSNTAPFAISFTPASGGSSTGSISLVGSVAVVSKKGKGRRSNNNITTDTASTTQVVAVSGTGVGQGQLTVSSAALNLGSVLVGSTQSQTVTLTNATGTTVNVNQAVASGNGFGVSGVALPFTLGAGQSQAISITFAPTSAGSASGSLSIASDATTNPSISVALSAVGVTPGSLTGTPTALNFSTVKVGSSQTLNASVTNSGGSSVSVTGASISGSGYSISGMSTPITLSPGQSKSFSVTFKPQTSGAANGQLAIASTATNSNLDIPLSATAVMAGTLTAGSATLSWGNVPVGTSQNQPETLTNSGGSSVTVSQASVSGAGFSVSGLTLPMTLAPGQSTSFSIGFAPSSGGNKTGTLNIASDASNPSLAVALSGTGQTPGMLGASSSTISFGGIQVGSNGSQPETLTNTGGTDVKISAATVTGNDFNITGLSVPMTLVPGQSFTFGVSFAPSSGGSASGAITVTSDAANASLTISLSGSGTVPGQLNISPTTLDFGSVIVGQNKSLTANLSASGSNVTVSSASVTTSEFKLSGISLPLTVTAGQSVPITIVFTPQASGTAGATLSFASNATNASLNETLTGSGSPAPQHSVSLSWAQSSSATVGYNVYRSTVSGGPFSKINSALNASTNFVDNIVQAGSTYYYVTTAVNGSGVESAYSNQVKAAIPTP
jgi:Abnormal spindle-like microcephaly-assoc'd, ASPM-SPD-2-Hydin